MPGVIWLKVGFPDWTAVDGAVVELCQNPDETGTADLRIPGHQPTDRNWTACAVT